MTTIRYIGRVYKMGQDKIVISVPKEDHAAITPLIGKKVKVEVTEAISNNGDSITYSEKDVKRVAKDLHTQLDKIESKKGRK